MAFTISGIQQIGLGLKDIDESWPWYREHFGFDVEVFSDEGSADLMTAYTGGVVQNRKSVFALNFQGGGGLELWQFTSREPQPCSFDLQLGDWGTIVLKLKTANIDEAYEAFKDGKLNLQGEISETPGGVRHFFVKDPWNNIFEVVENDWILFKTKKPVGGIFGVVIGVRDMDESLQLYREVLGYDEVIYDVEGQQEDLVALPGGEAPVRRVLLSSTKTKGPFSNLFGKQQIELVQLTQGEGRRIFADRYWGDLGFAHVAFDVRNMDALKKHCADHGFPFTVDSGETYAMEDAGGRFSYIEDPDGTLIEFVEVHKVPVLKRLGWRFDMRGRDPEKPLPNWMLRMLGFRRVKD